LGGIDFVIAGVAGNFLVPMRDLSANAFKSVMEVLVGKLLPLVASGYVLSAKPNL